MQERRSWIAMPRVVVWGLLAALVVYWSVNDLTGAGRDYEFRSVPWTATTYIEQVVVMIVMGGLFARAAYMTYTREVQPAPAGTLRFPGARLNGFGEVFFTLVGGLLLMVGAWMIESIPEMALAHSTEQFRHYNSADPTSNGLMGAFFGGIGFVLMILRRYVWEKQPGKPLRRYTARAFGRGHVVDKPVRLYITEYWQKQGYQRVMIARWVRVEDPSSKGFFRDGDIELLPVRASQAEMAAAMEQCRAWLASHGVEATVSAPPAAFDGTAA